MATSSVPKIEVVDIEFRHLRKKTDVDFAPESMSFESEIPDPTFSTTQLFESLLNQFEGTQALKDELATIESNDHEPELMAQWMDKALRHLVLELYKEEDSKDAMLRQETPTSYAAGDILPGATQSECDIVVVNPKPQKGPTSERIDEIVKFVVWDYLNKQDPVQLSKLSGNYAPVREETNSRDCKIVVGELPSAINGMYLRVGPDPLYDPEANYKRSDGNGMIHGVLIQDGGAKYVSHYVKNSRYKQEKEFGKSALLKNGDLRGSYGLFMSLIQNLRRALKVLDMSFGNTTSNVSVVYHAGRIMALEDFGQPYAISISEDGNMETIGMNTYDDKLKHNFTPHPKKDPKTGEMLAIALSTTEPYAYHTVIDGDGEITSDVPLKVSGPTYMHDFAITENYSIIMDNPYVYSKENMANKDQWVFQFDKSKPSRYGILPRNASDESDIVWFIRDDTSFIFHTLNAWEEGDNIIMYGCNMEPTYNEKTKQHEIHPLAFSDFTPKHVEGAKSDFTPPQLYKFTFDMTTKETTRESTKHKVAVLNDLTLESPKINEAYMGRKTRYGYATSLDMGGERGKTFGVYKHDFESGEGILKTIQFNDEEAFLSEHVFVPKESPETEDDGYLVLFAHVVSESNAYFVVLDAIKMTLVAVVDLQTRIPYGFHSTFVSQDELEQSRMMNLEDKLKFIL